VYYWQPWVHAAKLQRPGAVQASAAPWPSNQAINLVVQAGTSQWQLSWPQSHPGWRLRIQTNNLSNGLGADWATVPNSTNVNAMNLLINPANGEVFLRLVYP